MWKQVKQGYLADISTAWKHEVGSSALCDHILVTCLLRQSEVGAKHPASEPRLLSLQH